MKLSLARLENFVFLWIIEHTFGSMKWMVEVCTTDYELLSVSLRPFYLLQEFGQITIILIYITGLDYAEAANKISESLPTLHQYLNCPTRSMHTLEKCFGNIADGYKAVCRPLLGKSNHNIIHLLPKKWAKLKQEKPMTKEIQLWTDQRKEQLPLRFIKTGCKLIACIDEKEWQLFFDACDNVHEITDTITYTFLWK